MNLQEFAASRNIAPKHARTTAMAVLEYIPSEELNDEEIQKLDTALLQASSDFLSPEQKALTQSVVDILNPQEKRTLQHFIGAETLAANAQEYLHRHCQTLKDIKYAIDVANFQFVQAVHESTADALRQSDQYLNVKADKYLEVVSQETGMWGRFIDTFNELVK
jgi:hypothetical protein